MLNKTLLVYASVFTVQIVSANLIAIDPFAGAFNEGPLAGVQIEGFIEVDTNGLLSGTADTLPTTLGDGDLVDFGVQFETAEIVFFDLFDDLDPLATFDMDQVVGIDYFGTNFDGDNLNIFYDGFAEDALTGITVQYESFNGEISTGTLDLPTAVPEPATMALFLGFIGLGFAYLRRL